MFKGDLRVLQENDTMSFVKNKCTTTARPNVLYFDVRTCRRERECETPSVCVSSCPNRTFIYNTNECTPETLASIKANLTCQSSVNVASLANCEQVATVMAVPANCPRWYFPSKLGKFLGSLSRLQRMKLDPYGSIAKMRSNQMDI